jgi:agmatinase
MDVVEVSPPYDVAEITALAGATIALQMLCLYAQRPG